MPALKCPLCQSDDIHHEERQEIISDHYGNEQEVYLHYDSCNRCGTDGDFASQNDAIIEELLSRFKDETVKTILNEFSGRGANFANLERALELPQRTLSKWKNGAASPTAAGVTLLKMIRLFPWIISVASNEYRVTSYMANSIIQAISEPFQRKIEGDDIVTIEAEYFEISQQGSEIAHSDIEPQQVDTKGYDNNIDAAETSLAWQY